MAFTDFPGQTQGVELLQRSLERGRLAHAYLFTGHALDELEALGRALAKTLNCQNPKRAIGKPVDSCDECLNCRKVTAGKHADVHWVRPESKTRIIAVEQMRELMREIQLKPNEAEYKVAIIVAADRLKEQAANAFLKTLEEPPAKSVLILLTTEPQRLLDTIVSRCLRLKFESGEQLLDAARLEWVTKFGEVAAQPQKSLLSRYRLLDSLVAKLTAMKEQIDAALTENSPLEKYQDVEKELREQWEKELAAAIEAEYRLRRGELLAGLQLWLRDVWLRTLAAGEDLLGLPQLGSTAAVAQRISSKQALENLREIERLQRLLHSNVQEALALEVSLLKLHL